MTMNKILKRHLWTDHDRAQDNLALAEQMREEPEILTRLAEIVALYKSVLNPITPTADNPEAFISEVNHENH
jgi:hypothetical protein